ncbi:MAG TPA: hypothetical protein VFU29_01550 [Chitinophagaceae bacterium]|nr:hypothetical protein [Chitinophagaceae bacterium]
MKRSIISISIIATCMISFFMMSSFNTAPSATLSKAQNFNSAASILITSSNTTTTDNVNYVGNVQLTGAINASGTYVMPTEVFGMALHCTFILTLPQGTITIRMLCNMQTLNGRWTVLGGTGAYQNLRGGGSLFMPGAEEVLEGTVSL